MHSSRFLNFHKTTVSFSKENTESFFQKGEYSISYIYFKLMLGFFYEMNKTSLKLDFSHTSIVSQ